MSGRGKKRSRSSGKDTEFLNIKDEPDDKVVVVEGEPGRITLRAKTKLAESKAKQAESKAKQAEKKVRRVSGVMDSIADCWLCPITLELPIDPVTAEDGKIYERSAIEQWLRDHNTSPSTNDPIGSRLLPAPQAKATIEALVKSGAVADDKATAWKAKLADQEKLRKLREAADGGDGTAMNTLGFFYARGELGLREDLKRARSWFEAAAAKNNLEALGNYGWYLLNGHGGLKNIGLGIYFTMLGAEQGSTASLERLGECFQFAWYGLPMDHAKAKYWYEKVINHPDCENDRKTRVTEYLEYLALLATD